MRSEVPWTQDTFAASITGRAWTYTEYDGGWEKCRDSAELRALFAEEMTLGDVPDWAREIVERMLASPLPPCGHYTFPRPILQACEAIGQERCPEFVVGCYTADPSRKALMSRYVYCLDAWLQQAPPAAASAEFETCRVGDRDWSRIVAEIHQTLGEQTEPRVLLVRRLVHRLRWWIKTLIWEDDRRDRFEIDAYLGDARGSAEWGDYGNPGFHDPYFAELKVPEVQELARRIRDLIPDGEAILERIESTWLCAPKAFRYLERLILEIGSVGTDTELDFGRSLLQCEDTYPDLASSRQWHASFLASLDAWLAGDDSAVPALGGTTPVKNWLAGILRHRLQIYAGFSQYAAGVAQGRSGTMDLIHTDR